MKKLLLATIFVLTSIFAFSQSTYTQSFTTTGSSYWICPSGVTSVTVECYGGGGGGGGKNSQGSGGGGGGGYSKSVVSVTPNTKYYFTVGVGGTAGAAGSGGSNGGSGGSSWFNASTSSPYTSSNSQPTGTSSGILASGGSGGTAATAGAGGAGATTNYGSITNNGGNGATGINSSTNGGGGGGGGAGSTGSGGNGGTVKSLTAGSAGTGGGGAGGAGGLYVASGSNAGVAGTQPGGGGGGCYYFSVSNVAGGAGGSGKVVISYTACVPLFEQDFNASTTVSDYVNTTANHSQITSITAAQTINTTTSNKLRMDNSAPSYPYFSRVTDFVGSPTNVIVKFDVTFSALTSYSNAATYLYIGAGFTDGTVPSSSTAHSRLCFATQSANPTNQFAVRNVDPGATASNSGFYTGKQSITWVINNSGGSLSYLAPDGTTESVADDKEDIWVGTTKVWNDVGCWGSTKSLSNFYFKWTNGAGIMDIDNITINPIVSSPTSSVGSAINCSSFNANWTTSNCNASLEVATNNTFTSMVSGYPLSVTSSPYSVTGLSAGTTYYYRLRTSMGSNSNAINSAYSTTQNITTTSASVGGSVAADQNVMSGADAATVNLSGHTGSVIKWQRSTISDFSTATDVANTTTFVNGPSMGGITETIYYRAVVQNGTCATANSAYVTITVVSGLPIELLYFNGVECETGNRLSWSTVSENNNDYFTIEKTKDGKDWISIVNLNGAGNSSTQLYYYFMDENIESIINYYRLKQTDYDGKFKYSDAISIDNRNKTEAKEVYKIVNALGQEVDLRYYRGLVIIEYSDGSSEKIIK